VEPKPERIAAGGPRRRKATGARGTRPTVRGVDGESIHPRNGAPGGGTPKVPEPGAAFPWVAMLASINPPNSNLRQPRKVGPAESEAEPPGERSEPTRPNFLGMNI